MILLQEEKKIETASSLLEAEFKQMYTSRTFVDLHAHATGAYNFIWNIPLLKGKDYGKTGVHEALVEKSFQVAEEKCIRNTLVAILNFGDRRGEGILREMARLNGYDIDYSEYRISLYKKSKAAHFIIGEEIPTEIGHICVIGAGRNSIYRRFEDVIKEARDKNAVVIADHPLKDYGFFARVGNRLINGNARFGLREEEILRYKDSLDALESWSDFIDKENHEKIERVAEFLGISTAVSTDSHFARRVLHSGMYLDLNYSDNEILKESIRIGLKKRDKTMDVLGNKQRVIGLKHGLEVVWRNLILNFHIVKRKEDL